jgi:hypothetical protein
MIIIRNAAPHRYLSRSFAPGVSFGTDVRAAGVSGPLESTKLADESLGVEGVSFLLTRCSVGARGTSPRFVDDTSGFISVLDAANAGASVAVFASWS